MTLFYDSLWPIGRSDNEKELIDNDDDDRQLLMMPYVKLKHVALDVTLLAGNTR